MPEGVQRLRRDALGEFAAALRGRRSITLYEPEAPDPADLLDAIELARWAPNHRLTEPWKFYLIGKKTAAEIIDFAAEFDTARKGEQAGAARRARLKSIPGFFLLTCRKSADELLQREDYAACCCAVQNATLYLWECGIGVKWSTGAMTRERRFYEILSIDHEAELVVGLFWYGYPKVVPTQKRRGVDEIVVERP
ncbi:MAG TPA: nitroreductase family protein [Gammaproteobacteria bacterium]|nr:nitroreductase family protein [Gammaproteobacteria bacterium]